MFKTIFGTLWLLEMIIIGNMLLTTWFLDKKTKYKNDISTDGYKVTWTLLLFGIFVVFFMKRFKQYRKDIYYERRLRNLNWDKLNWLSFGDYWEKSHGEEYRQCNRYLKLRRLQKKSKHKFLKLSI